MRIEPKDFQDDAVIRLTEEIESARREIEGGADGGADGGAGRRSCCHLLPAPAKP
jgi:hypothetical protein